MRDPFAMDAHVRLQEWLSQTGVIVPVEAISDRRIDALEDRYSLKVPADFRAYLAASCPTQDNWDEEMGNWWPFSRIRNISDEYPYDSVPENASKYLFFLDHCIWCWAWAISCADDETHGSIVVVGGPERIVAASFSEFVDRYINDWISVS